MTTTFDIPAADQARYDRNDELAVAVAYSENAGPAPAAGTALDPDGELPF
ncbi:hypothetical protein [Pseudonocardia kunmingensis]|uniref:Uncharacterized protein n=1 Tax=Pseudonocardia kunmingensis TaxID=630975 RepID=A0A543CX62_9PSEU|nr:hypothetical protein [Pseudonocardia kunmingensis]TQM01703.1 hypothetical protein FB558_8604 [Pseudonocardia kunmingensis]